MGVEDIYEVTVLKEEKITVHAWSEEEAKKNVLDENKDVICVINVEIWRG